MKKIFYNARDYQNNFVFEPKMLHRRLPKYSTPEHETDIYFWWPLFHVSAPIIDQLKEL